MAGVWGSIPVSTSLLLFAAAATTTTTTTTTTTAAAAAADTLLPLQLLYCYCLPLYLTGSHLSPVIQTSILATS